MKYLPMILILSSIVFLFNSCGSTSLEGYKPKDQSEADIKALLIKYKNAIENDDIPQFLSCFSDDCKFMILSGSTLNKDELSKELPNFFAKWTTVDISDVKISVENNSARVQVKEKIKRTSGHEYLGLNKMGLTHFSLVLENGEWLIAKSSKN